MATVILMPLEARDSMKKSGAEVVKGDGPRARNEEGDSHRVS
jgi:hypothetical protein